MCNPVLRVSGTAVVQAEPYRPLPVTGAEKLAVKLVAGITFGQVFQYRSAASSPFSSKHALAACNSHRSVQPGRSG